MGGHHASSIDPSLSPCTLGVTRTSGTGGTHRGEPIDQAQATALDAGVESELILPYECE